MEMLDTTFGKSISEASSAKKPLLLLEKISAKQVAKKIHYYFF